MQISEPDNHDRMTLMANINNHSTESVCIRAQMHSLPEVLETLERFIRACGYNPEGQLNFVSGEPFVVPSQTFLKDQK